IGVPVFPGSGPVTSPTTGRSRPRSGRFVSLAAGQAPTVSDRGRLPGSATPGSPGCALGSEFSSSLYNFGKLGATPDPNPTTFPNCLQNNMLWYWHTFWLPHFFTISVQYIDISR